jgi:hypothetical protein
MQTSIRSRVIAALALAAVFAAAGGMAIGKDTARTPEKRAEVLMEAKIDRALAAYKVAKKRCGAVRGDAARSCVYKARSDRDAAIRLAKIEKVRKIADLKDKEEDRKKHGTAPTPSAQAKYAAAKARCEMMGFERDECLADLKQRFPRT